MLQMIIVGGGIHGVHLAHRLLQQTPLTHDDIRILDPHKELLHEWWQRARNCGMRYLRSPKVHQIDIDPWSLAKYADKLENRSDTNFIPPKDRPSVELFHRHCRMVIDNHRLESLQIRGLALEILDRIGHVSVVTSEERIQARFVLLALGMGEQPFWPPWASRIKKEGLAVNHVFDPGFSLKNIQADGTIAVIGAGISGGHLALHLTEKGFDSVLLVSKKDNQVSDFDFDPGWLGPKYLDQFYRRSYDLRRSQIMAARTNGSVPRDMKIALDKVTALNKLTCIVDEIIDAKDQGGGALLIGRHGRYDCQKIVLATGFIENRPGNGFINQAIKEFGLKTAACGFPVIGPSLQWHERIFVTGPLSELQIGPSARNIAGARHSGRIITAAFKKESIPRKKI